MRIFIDADSCPVTDEAVALAQEYDYECITVCDESHQIKKDGIVSIVVPVGDNSTDYAILGMIKRDDILITDDTGLAGICEAKGAVILNHLAEKYCSEKLYESMWILNRRWSRKRRKKRNLRLVKMPKRKLLFSERFGQLLAEKQLLKQKELMQVQNNKYQEKLKRRKERQLEEKRLAEQLNQKPTDIVDLFFWHENRKGKKHKHQGQKVIY